MRVVMLQHRCKILVGSLASTNTNLGEDAIDISDTPGSTWGR